MSILNRPVFVTTNNIRNIRLTAKLTAQQVADRCGVSVWAVNSWERGEHHPQRGNSTKVAAFLNSILHRQSIQFSYSTDRADQLVSDPTQ